MTAEKMCCVGLRDTHYSTLFIDVGAKLSTTERGVEDGIVSLGRVGTWFKVE